MMKKRLIEIKIIFDLISLVTSKKKLVEFLEENKFSTLDNKEK